MRGAVDALDRRSWIDIAALGVTQIVGYGTLYYSFGILAPSMAEDLGWPKQWVFGALSIALLIGGLLARSTGRWIDRYGAGRVMAVGSVAAALALVAAALAPSGLAFALALIAIEMASTFVQYGAAFALLVQRHQQTAQRSIVYLTLIAGFASTLFWPLTTWLHGLLTWREVYLLFAALNLLICLPIHARLSRRRGVARAGAERRGDVGFRPAPGGSLPRDARSTGFLLMGTAFALQSFVSSAVLVHMLPMLGALGLGVAGVTVSALFGPSQVASRLINMIFGQQVSQLALAVTSAALLPGALLLLVATAPAYAGALLFAVLFGMGNGLYSIVIGTLPLALFGAEGYGTRQGEITSIRLIVGSFAPFVFASMMDGVGTAGALIASTVLGCGGVAALIALSRLASTADPCAPSRAGNGRQG
jgi:MFS family permease